MDSIHIGWLLAGLGLVIVCALAIPSFWIYKRSVEARCFKHGLEHIRQGDRRAGLASILCAERAWMLNLNQQSTESHLRDLTRLKDIVRAIDDCCVEPMPSAETQELHVIVDEMAQLQSNRENFGIDGRMMKSAAASEWVQLIDRLKAARLALRSAFAAPQQTEKT